MGGLRITTWNVNGIRNPFAYQPWRDKRTFQAMFDILEADIVVMQETKIQRKDLRDDMVLVPGWDVYFSLPKHKKGYSGVAIYTRNAVCAPIRAEEGITGILTPPNSSTSFCDLPEDQQIGGYPSISQLSNNSLDAATLDSEGRCVILEFPAFVLIGVYNPANRDETRDEFRLGFLNALDARVRNLVAVGKRVFLTGDLNIIREELDTANAEEQLRKHGMTGDEYVSTPARRMLNQLLVDGRVIGQRDEGREYPVMVDLCRSFHPGRKGMFTCWETKINARPGNFGSRIDYVLCSKDWKDWFSGSNIQEGLIGSDHCPVFAMLNDKVKIDDTEISIKDIINPAGMFHDGVRQREWSPKDLLPMSARLIPEFDRRRSIRDMFAKRPSLPADQSTSNSQSGIRNGTKEKSLDERETPSTAHLPQAENVTLGGSYTSSIPNMLTTESNLLATNASTDQSAKRAGEPPSTERLSKRSKSIAKANSVAATGQSGKGQSSLMGFFRPKAPASNQVESKISHRKENRDLGIANAASSSESTPPTASVHVEQLPEGDSSNERPGRVFNPDDQQSVVDPIAAKETWSKLLGKRVVPRCDHNEPCVSFKTKKPGENCGRSFFICARPLGPSGQKEKNSQWRCGTFIWSSDWTSGDETLP